MCPTRRKSNITMRFNKITPTFLIGLLLVGIFSCRNEKPPINKMVDKNLLKQAECQRDEVIYKIKIALNPDHKDMCLLWRLEKQLGIFQDDVTFDFLVDIAQGVRYDGYFYIYGLSRQGNKGKKFLYSLREQDHKLKLTDDERRKQGKIVRTSAGGAGYSAMLYEIIDEQLKYTEDIDIQQVEMDIYQVLEEAFFKAYESYIARNFLNRKDVSDPVLNNKYLGTPIPRTSMLVGLMPQYPGSIFERATFSSVLQALSSKDVNRKLIAALILSYWGLDLGSQILLEEIEKNQTDKLKCMSAIVVLKYVRLGNNNINITKQLIELIEKGSISKEYEELILETIAELRTDEGDNFLMDYSKKKFNPAIITIFSGCCGMGTEEFWQELLDEQSGMDYSKTSLTIQALILYYKFALERIKTLKSYKEISPDLSDLYRAYL